MSSRIGSVVAALLLAWCCGAAAQLRSIPQDARAGEMRHLQDMIVAIDGKPARLAPGAQIRDAANRIVVPMALPAGAKVRYQLDGAGMVARVWILDEREAASARAAQGAR